MKASLKELLPLFWRPEYRNAWRLCWEKEVDRRILIPKAIRYLPPEIGQLEFYEDFPHEKFIIIVTYDEESEGGRQNAAWIFLILAETRGIKFYGTEGAWEKLDVDWLRAFPDQNIKRKVAEQQMDAFNLSPLEFVLLVSNEPIDVWGIEDHNLYEAAVEKYKTKASDYWDLIGRRGSVMFQNLYSKMEESNVRLACVSLTDYNFSVAHHWFSKKGIAHAGIRSLSTGKKHWGRLEAALKGEIVDEFAEAIRKTLGEKNKQ